MGDKGMKEYCFGIDVGGTTVKMGLFRVDGELLEKWEIPSRTENEGKAILPDIAEAVQKKLEERGIEKDSVTGIGIGVPGPINAEGIVPHISRTLSLRDAQDALREIQRGHTVGKIILSV